MNRPCICIGVGQFEEVVMVVLGWEGGSTLGADFSVVKNLMLYCERLGWIG